MGNNFEAHVLFLTRLASQERAVLEKLIQSGWAVVPRVATEEMLKESWAAVWESNASEAWREMIEAGEITVEEIQKAKAACDH